MSCAGAGSVEVTGADVQAPQYAETPRPSRPSPAPTLAAQLETGDPAATHLSAFSEVMGPLPVHASVFRSHAGRPLRPFREARRREPAVVCQQPPVVGSTQFGGRRRSRPRGSARLSEPWQTSSPVPYKSSSAACDVSLARFGLRLLRAMQPSAARKRQLSAWHRTRPLGDRWPDECDRESRPIRSCAGRRVRAHLRRAERARCLCKRCRPLPARRCNPVALIRAHPILRRENRCSHPGDPDVAEALARCVPAEGECDRPRESRFPPGDACESASQEGTTAHRNVRAPLD